MDLDSVLILILMLQSPPLIDFLNLLILKKNYLTTRRILIMWPTAYPYKVQWHQRSSFSFPKKLFTQQKLNNMLELTLQTMTLAQFLLVYLKVAY